MVEIVDSTFQHARELSKTLRQEDRLEAENLGMNPTRLLFRSYRSAVYKKTALVNNKIAAMWGVSGTLLANRGEPYLLTGIEALNVSPLVFMRVYKQEVSIMRTMFPILENYVDLSYFGAVKALRLAGFSFFEPIYVNGNAFSKFQLITKE